MHKYSEPPLKTMDEVNGMRLVMALLASCLCLPTNVFAQETALQMQLNKFEGGPSFRRLFLQGWGF
jgi:hypothetical protein